MSTHDNYPNGDLWTVRQIELLDGALEDMAGKQATYWPDLEYELNIPNVAAYRFKGILDFGAADRTIMFEQGDGFGVGREEVTAYLGKYSIVFTEKFE